MTGRVNYGRQHNWRDRRDRLGLRYLDQDFLNGREARASVRLTKAYRNAGNLAQLSPKQEREIRERVEAKYDRPPRKLPEPCIKEEARKNASC